MEVLLVAVAALAATAIAVPVCIVFARRWGIMDRPGPLKTHEAPVAYLGGVAVFAGVVVGAWAGRPVALVPLAAALAVGVSDDRFGLPPPCGLQPSWASERSSPSPSPSTSPVGSVYHSSWRPLSS